MPKSPTEAEKAYLERIVRGVEVFRSISDADIAELIRNARSLALPRGRTISPPKGRGDEIYVIERGAAALLLSDFDAERQILVALFGPGEVFGLLRAAELLGGFKADQRREWRALSNLSLVAIPVADFLRVRRRSSELSEALFVHFAQSICALTARMSAALQSPLEMRLASLFSELAAIATGNRWEPAANIGRVPQTLIADMLCVSREHVNRTLIMWERSGLIFQSKSGDIIIENRERLLHLSGGRREAIEGSTEHERFWEIDAYLNYGLNGAAYDLAMEGVKRAPKESRFKYLAVLAKSRMGALTEALSLADEFKLSEDAANEDIASVGPKLRREIAFVAPNGPDIEQLRLAAEGYEKIFRNLRKTYPGVNAASTYAMAGEFARARRLAQEVGRLAAAEIEELDEDAVSYWERATLAECLLVEGDRTGAAAHFAAARRARDAAPGKISSTRAQLRRLKGALELDDRLIESLAPQGSVLYFCGPLTPPDPGSAASLDRLTARFGQFLKERRIVAAVGALAAGADIVIAEMLLEAGVPLHVCLPLHPGEFLEASVRPSGGDWPNRCISCFERAQSIDWTRWAPRSRAAYRLAARIAMGETIRMAEELTTDAVGFFAVQRGRSTTDSISWENARSWQDLGLAGVIDEGDWLAVPPSAKDQHLKEYFAALVVDGPAAAEAESVLAGRPRFAASRESQSIFAFDDPESAAAAAAAVMRRAESASTRLWLDVGVADADTERGRLQFPSTLVTASCRPLTTPGKVYASEGFVYAAAACKGQRRRFDYAGFTPVQEKLGPCPLFLASI